MHDYRNFVRNVRHDPSDITKTHHKHKTDKSTVAVDDFSRLQGTSLAVLDVVGEEVFELYPGFLH
jgi:hypothetical protein